ncbi:MULTISPECIES: hypothetical protein [unclassified Psychrobacter]|uniref:hypothetical protein n=1 Tax=unclassified Psychrobacter TaxID=196806 RepID=UPI0025B5FB9B|nr:MULTISPECIES: hypothetical protein [unclassified Psychrobacter]MDN3454439.1 hypothetical protein [Psychrobacter sp. APC 3350]MDN3503318.1 hypothetical protein [Psychrobacter sp. 5A.1]
MGPDISDGIITNIDSILYKAYIRDAYEDTVFYYDLCKYTGKDVLLVGTQVTYYKLYYKTPVAVGLLTKKEICNSELFKSYDKKRHYSSHHEQGFEMSTCKTLLLGTCLSLGIIAGLLGLF